MTKVASERQSLYAKDASMTLIDLDGLKWRENNEAIDERVTWFCPNCENRVGGVRGWRLLKEGQHSSSAPAGWVAACNVCKFPTFICYGEQFPGIPFGRALDHLPADVEAIYNEARRCCSVNAYSAAVMLCRKLIMHLAHSLSDPEAPLGDLSFAKYIEWLEANQHIPKKGRVWVDWIRSRGNQENHELVRASSQEADRMISFVHALLLWNYVLEAEYQESSTTSNP